MNKKRKAILHNTARLIPLTAVMMTALFLLPWISVAAPQGGEAFTQSGLSLLIAVKNVINLLPLGIAAAICLALGLISIKPSRPVLRALVVSFALALICGLYALLSAKLSADQSGLLPVPFLVRHFRPAFFAFLLLSLLGLIFSLIALRQPTIYIILTAMAAVWLMPILWLVITSFRAEAGAYTTYIIPNGWTLNNYTRLFSETQQFNFPRWYMNTLLVSVITCALTTMMVLMISYTFSRLRFTSRKLLMNIGLIVTMFPGFMSMIAVYHILKAVGLAKSLVSLVLVYTGSGVLGYTIAKGFFDTIPRSLDEAATIDGATKNMVFWRITLPSSRPIIVYTAITAFIAPWVDFIFVSVIMKDDYANYTVALGLFRMLEREHIYEYFTRFAAGAVLVAIPITLLFIRIQKFYIEGVTGGAVKG